MKVQIIHGLGMDMRGIQNVETFGPMKLEEYDARIRLFAAELNIDVSIGHSNNEDEIVSILGKANNDAVSGVLFNPAGFMEGHPKIATALQLMNVPVYELHNTNPVSRGRVSDLLKYCSGSITGFGVNGYRLGLSAIALAKSNL